LRSAGYTTTAIQPDPRHWYDRERIYPLLGFDQVIWLDEKPGIDRDTRVDWPTDHAVVEAVIAASRGPRPFFTFAFPSATHSPYHTGAYSGSDLDVINADATDKRGEVKEYVNAIHRADQAIGALVHHFRRRPDSTVIVVLGDHLPPLSEGARYTFTQRVSQASPAEQARLLHRVPLLIWANFALPRESQELSVNALPSFLLEKLAIPPTGFFAMAATIRRTMPVVGKYVTRSNGTVWSRDSLPVDLKALLHDYELLQYDLLLGKRYSLREGITELLRRPFYSPVPGALLSHQDDFHLVSRSEIGQRRVVAEASILQIPD
jgi:hypothetical protein